MHTIVVVIMTSIIPHGDVRGAKINPNFNTFVAPHFSLSNFISQKSAFMNHTAQFDLTLQYSLIITHMNPTNTKI